VVLCVLKSQRTVHVDKETIMPKRKAQRGHSSKRKAQRGHPSKKRNRKKQKGGGNPFLVDFKRGIRVTKDMIKAVKTPVNVEKAKATVRGYKQEYHDYKRRGGNKSYNNWIIDKGYGERRPECCIM